MTHPSLLLGVDGGNSKTIALIAAADGTILGAGRAGVSDIYGASSAEAALAELERAVSAALRAAGASPDAVLAASFSLAGADWSEDFVYLEAAVRDRGWGRSITVVNDAIGALRAGSPDGIGVAVACGTGTAIGARSSAGHTWHTSHWQEQYGGHDMGRAALRAVYRAELGLDPPTRLTARILADLGRDSVEEVLHLFTARLRDEGFDRERRARQLARALLDEADAGDPAARRIVRDFGAGLGDYALVAARRVGLLGESFPLVMVGGVFRHPSSLLGDVLVARVRAEAPQACPVAGPFEPAVGSLLLAFDMAGIRAHGAVLERLTSSLPPASLYAT